MRTRTLALALLVALASGCSSSDKGPAAGTTRSVPAPSDLARMVALVPRTDALSLKGGVWFADIARQKRNYGFDRVASADALDALPPADQIQFQRAVFALPIAMESGAGAYIKLDWRGTVGYDFWQTDRTIYAGDPPNTWALAEGRYDRAAIERSLNGLGYTRTAGPGAALFSRGGDADVDPRAPFPPMQLGALNRIAAGDGWLEIARTTALAQAGIGARAGQAPNLASDPDIGALAQAMGEVVAAALLPGATFYAADPAAAILNGQTPAPYSTALHAYSAVGIGLRDDGTTHTMIVALV